MNFIQVKYQPERSRTYIGSPSIVKLRDGALLCSHDYFGRLVTLEGDNGLSSIYRSEDDGQTWENITHIINGYWGTLFVVKDDVYHISMTRDYGDVVIRKSSDGGFTWTRPQPGSGILRKGPGDAVPHAFRIEQSGTECICDNRIYKCYDIHTPDRQLAEKNGWSAEWNPQFFASCVMSASLDDDLLAPYSWTHTNTVPFDTRLCDAFPEAFKPGSGWLEGTAVKAPDGTMAVISRVHCNTPNKAVLMTLGDDHSTLSLDYKTGIIDFPSAPSRFTIRQDPRTGLYVTFANAMRPMENGRYTSRNLLVMSVSEDLRHWREVRDVIKDDTGLPPDYSRQLTGFQYNAWQFDGDDVILLSRMGYRGAHSYHDANRLGFFRFQNFRQWL